MPADPSSARMPTSIDTNAEPVLSPVYPHLLFSSPLPYRFSCGGVRAAARLATALGTYTVVETRRSPGKVQKGHLEPAVIRGSWQSERRAFCHHRHPAALSTKATAANPQPAIGRGRWGVNAGIGTGTSKGCPERQVSSTPAGALLPTLSPPDSPCTCLGFRSVPFGCRELCGSRGSTEPLFHHVVVHHEAGADVEDGLTGNRKPRGSVEPDGPGVLLVDLQK